MVKKLTILKGSTLKIDSSSVNSQGNILFKLMSMPIWDVLSCNLSLFEIDVCPLPLYEVANSPSCLMDTLTYTLAAPTSGCVRKGEGSLTFLNKNQVDKKFL